MVNTNSLIGYDPRLFLFRALSELEELENVPIEQIDEINRQIVAIMNKRSVMEPVDISKLSELRTVARDVVLRLNLGLEHGSKLDLIRAGHLLAHNDMIRFYQIGNTVMTKLKRDAEALQQRARLTIAESGMAQVGGHPEAVMELPLLNQIEEDFLSALIDENLIIGEVAAVIKSKKKKAQPIEQLSQVEIADGMLKNLSLRLDYLQTLPLYLIAKEKDFRYVESGGWSEDFAGKITCGMMVNLAIEGSRHFCVTIDSVRRFRADCITTNEVSEAVEEKLLAWLIEYLETHQATEAVIDYAYDYWIYWLNQLGRYLQKPIVDSDMLQDWFIL
jgi:hypothetical protein